MCILYQTHSLPCDVRPFLALAKPSPAGNLPITHVDPYSPPLTCSHRHRRGSTCLLHGCCTLTTISLPCDCADTAPWGGIAVGTEADEDITRCPHYREYHRYVCVNNAAGTDETLDLYGDDDPVLMEKWPEYPTLDAWVAMPQARREPDRQPNFFCERAGWRAAVERLIGSGRRLWAEVSRAEERSRMVEEEGEGAVRGEEMKLGGRAVAEAWEEVKGRQDVLRGLHKRRAEALLGFEAGVGGGGGGEGGGYPGGMGFV